MLQLRRVRRRARSRGTPRARRSPGRLRSRRPRAESASTILPTCAASLSSSRLRASARTTQRSGHDVDGRAAAHDADVGRRLVVESAEVHGGDGAGRGDDRAPARLRLDARVGGRAAELRLDRLERRPADDGRAGRAFAVEDEDHLGGERADVEALAPCRPISSPAENTTSTAAAGGSAARSRSAMRMAVTAALSSPPRIVSPSVCTTPFSTITAGARSSGTVSMCAESAIGVPCPRPGTRTTRLPQAQPVTAAVSSSRIVQAEAADVVDDGVGHRAFLARGRADRDEPDEEVAQLV